MKEGKKFEEDFKKSVPGNFFIYRLRDSAGAWQGGENTRFTPSNLCDYILFRNTLYLLELKSTLGASIPLGNFNLKHLKKLALESEKNKVKGGVVINFRDKEKTYYLPAQKVQDFIRSADRKSLPIQYAQVNGTLIAQTLKRTRYRYDIKGVFNE